jgi:hypothetical protein
MLASQTRATMLGYFLARVMYDRLSAQIKGNIWMLKQMKEITLFFFASVIYH